MIKKIYRSTRNALKGFRSGIENDESIRLELSVGLVVFVGLFVLFWPLRGLEILLLVLAYVLILITEFLNTAMETMLDRLHPVRHRMIGMSKDIAAAAVFLSFAFAGAVVLILTLSRMGIIAL